MRKWLLALALCAPMAASAATSTEATRPALDQIVPPLLAQSGVPSVSIAAIQHGAVVVVAAYGQQSAGVKATPQTLYNIASLTKPITAEVVLRLASQGKFTLDEPMYPAWTDSDIVSDPRTRLLTPRLMLSHRSGFPNWRDRKTGLAFKRDPGGTVGYSGEGFDYVARFAEKKTGESFEALTQRLLFKPAGMTSTSQVGQPWFEGRIAVPTDSKGVALKPYIRTRFSGADAVYTTAADYAAFMVEVLHDKGLSPEVAGERVRIQSSERETSCQGAKAATCPKDIGFGLGWQVLAFDHETIAMHTGKDEGVFTLAYLNRTTGDGAVILTSGDEGAKLVMPVLEALGASPAYIAYLKSQ